MPKSKLKVESGKWKVNQASHLNSRFSTLNFAQQNISSQLKPGFSLIDVLLTMFLVVMFSSILLVGSGSYLTSRKSTLNSIASRIASEQIGYLRNLDYATLLMQLPTFNHADLSKISSDAAGSQTIIPNPPTNYPDTRLVTTKVTWTEDGENKSVQMQTLIYQNGL